MRFCVCLPLFLLQCTTFWENRKKYVCLDASTISMAKKYLFSSVLPFVENLPYFLVMEATFPWESLWPGTALVWFLV